MIYEDDFIQRVKHKLVEINDLMAEESGDYPAVLTQLEIMIADLNEHVSLYEDARHFAINGGLDDNA